MEELDWWVMQNNDNERCGTREFTRNITRNPGYCRLVAGHSGDCARKVGNRIERWAKNAVERELNA